MSGQIKAGEVAQIAERVVDDMLSPGAMLLDHLEDSPGLAKGAERRLLAAVLSDGVQSYIS